MSATPQDASVGLLPSGVTSPNGAASSWDALINSFALWAAVLLAASLGGAGYLLASRNGDEIADLTKRSQRIAELSTRSDEIDAQIDSLKKTVAAQPSPWPAGTLDSRLAELRRSIELVAARIDLTVDQEKNDKASLDGRLHGIDNDLSAIHLRLGQDTEAQGSLTAKISQISSELESRNASLNQSMVAKRFAFNSLRPLTNRVSTRRRVAKLP